MTRMRKAAALALALTLLTAGCGMQTLPPTNVTATSATLRAQVYCSAKASGTVWWELRSAGGSWKLAGAKTMYACGRDKRPLSLSKTVTGLRGGTTYQYRLGADPNPVGGLVVHSSASQVATRSSATTAFTPGLVASADHQLSANAARRVGAKVVRVEFEIGTPASQLRQSVAEITAAGARPLLLAGFHGRMPSVDEAHNLGSWASAFGPGGSFWKGRSDGALAVQQIEFGNETSGGYQYGDDYAAPSYAARAELYARRFVQAHDAIALTGRHVGLLAQADDGGSASANWVNHMFRAVPKLGQYVDGWTVHPYGPRERWKPKLDRLIAFTKINGASSRIPIDVTEYGISSDNGASLGDNYGWSPSTTYSQAAGALRDTVSQMRSDPAIGPRLRLFMIYAAHDLGTPRSSADRERYFGVLQANLADKGAYTAEARSLFAQ
jgi:hypothetical protein